MSEGRAVRIVIVDDDPDDRRLATRLLRREFGRVEVLELASDEFLEEVWPAKGFDLVITDYDLKVTTGLRVLERVKELQPDVPVIMHTGTGSEEVAVAAMKGGLDDYVVKTPRHRVRLVAAARAALDRGGARRRSRDVETRLQHILDRLDVGVFRATGEGGLLEGNRALERILGLSSLCEAVGRPAEAWLKSEEDRAAVRASLREEGRFSRRGVEILRGDGSTAWTRLDVAVSETAAGARVADGLLVDITERKRAADALREKEDLLRQAAKMEAIGQLATGVAHDFNNLLVVILGYASLLLKSLHDADPRQGQVAQIHRAAESAAALTRQLLAFGRKQPMSPQLTCLNRSVRMVEKMLRRVIGEDIRLETALDPELPPVLADPGQIEQVLLNLAVNARDAMPEGGDLRIATRSVPIDAHESSRLVALEPGEYVELEVRDTGRGMDEATKERIFEPFFSTKERGAGTGLGLSTAYGIVRQFDGAIDVASRPGEGATFRIYLPRSASAAETAAEESAPSTRVRSETILVVEDERSVRELAALSLRQGGYRVVEATDGASALTGLDRGDEPVDLVLTDLVMPGIGGEELARKIHEARPELPVLFMSGYFQPEEVAAPEHKATAGFLRKPFTPNELLEAVDSLLT